ncbi:MAG: hypothetical protein S4CHLAM102_15920 [Chlamydiia bacterium]|nr:hypothetical protein [Chlamydiia bacterium]
MSTLVSYDNQQQLSKKHFDVMDCWEDPSSKTARGKIDYFGGRMYIAMSNPQNEAVSLIWKFNQGIAESIPRILRMIQSSGDYGEAKVRDIHSLVLCKLEDLVGDLDGIISKSLTAPSIQAQLGQFKTLFLETVAGVEKKCSELLITDAGYENILVAGGTVAASQVYCQIGDIKQMSFGVNVSKEHLDDYYMPAIFQSEIRKSPTMSGIAVPMIKSRDVVFKHFILKMAALPAEAFSHTPLFMAVCGYSLANDLRPGDIICYYNDKGEKAKVGCLPAGYNAEIWGFVDSNGQVEMAWADDPSIYTAPITCIPSHFQRFQIFRQSKEIMTTLEMCEMVTDVEEKLFEGCFNEFMNLVYSAYEIDLSRVTDCSGRQSKKKGRRPQPSGINLDLIRERVKSMAVKYKVSQLSVSIAGFLSSVFECPEVHQELAKEFYRFFREIGVYILENGEDKQALKEALTTIVRETVKTQFHLLLRRELISSLRMFHVTGLRVVEKTFIDDLKEFTSERAEKEEEEGASSNVISQLMQYARAAHAPNQSQVLAQGLGRLGGSRFIRLDGEDPMPENVVYDARRLACLKKGIVDFHEEPLLRLYERHLRAWCLANYDWRSAFLPHTSKFSPTFNPEHITPKEKYKFERKV